MDGSSVIEINTSVMSLLNERPNIDEKGVKGDGVAVYNNYSLPTSPKIEEGGDDIADRCRRAIMNPYTSLSDKIMTIEEIKTAVYRDLVDENTENKNTPENVDFNGNRLLNSHNSETSTPDESVIATVKVMKIKNSRKDFIQDENVLIPKGFWRRFWTFKRLLDNGWSDAFIELFKKSKPYTCCVFVIKYHQCYQGDKESAKYFYVSAPRKIRNAYNLNLKLTKKSKTIFRHKSQSISTPQYRTRRNRNPSKIH